MRESGFDNIYNLNSKRIRNRRIKVFGLMFLSTLLATAKWVTVIPTDSTVFTKILMVSLFILTFAWIALFFWSSDFGFFELLAQSSAHCLGSRKYAFKIADGYFDAGLQRIAAKRFCQPAGDGK